MFSINVLHTLFTFLWTVIIRIFWTLVFDGWLLMSVSFTPPPASVCVSHIQIVDKPYPSQPSYFLGQFMLQKRDNSYSILTLFSVKPTCQEMLLAEIAGISTVFKCWMTCDTEIYILGGFHGLNVLQVPVTFLQ